MLFWFGAVTLSLFFKVLLLNSYMQLSAVIEYNPFFYCCQSIFIHRCCFRMQISQFSAVIKYYFLYLVLLMNIISFMCCPKMKYDIWCCWNIWLFQFSAVDILCGFSLVTYVIVSIVKYCSQDCKIVCAVNDICNHVSFWCCSRKLLEHLCC